MARQEKNTVDYFPHDVHSGKTMFIIETKYGNDGYACWFKLLELLGSTENHFIDCRNPETWEFMIAKMKLTGELANNILDTLANLNAIHKELWQLKIIWSENFINNIKDAYKRRNSLCMQFDDLCKHLQVKCKHKPPSIDINADINPQSKLKESKVKEITPEHFEIVWNLYPNSIGRKKALTSFLASVETLKDFELIKSALENYKKSERVNKGFIQNGSTWFNNWQDWIPKEEPKKKPITREEVDALFGEVAK